MQQHKRLQGERGGKQEKRCPEHKCFIAARMRIDSRKIPIFFKFFQIFINNFFKTFKIINKITKFPQTLTNFTQITLINLIKIQHT